MYGASVPSAKVVATVVSMMLAPVGEGDIDFEREEWKRAHSFALAAEREFVRLCLTLVSEQGGEKYYTVPPQSEHCRALRDQVQKANSVANEAWLRMRLSTR